MVPIKTHEDHTRCYEIVKNIGKTFNRNCFSWCDNPLSITLIGLAMMLVPALLRAGGSKLHVLMLFSFLNQIGMKVKPKIISSIVPSKNTLTRCIKRVGVETLGVLRRQVIGQTLFY